MNLQTAKISFGDLLQSLDIYDHSLCDLNFSKDQTKSAVAIIVKKSQQKAQTKNSQCPSLVQDQVLFLQRKISLNDRFSGQICFPGGKQQPGQTLLNTAIRETFQETNILLTQQNLVGCINRQVNFIISSKKELQGNEAITPYKLRKQMVVYSFVFIVQSEFIDAQIIKINHEEMETYQWVKASELTDPRNACFLDYTGKISSLSRVYEQDPIMKENKNLALECMSRALSPALNVKMKEKLYGITFYIYLILISHLIEKIKGLIEKSESLTSTQLYSLRRLNCNLAQIKLRSEDHVIFELKKPISEQFRLFEQALLKGLYTMRPKL